MKWLLWREYRLNRPILIAGSVFLLLPYVIVLIVLWWAPVGPDAATAFGGAAIYSVVLSQLTLAFLGGNAIAGERADRSAEFIAYLPLSRPRRLAGKLSLTLATAALFWGVNLSVLLILLSMTSDLRPVPYNDLPSVLGYIAITGLAFFGVGWLVSSLQSSATFAVCGGLITPLLIVMGLQAAAWLSAAPSLDEFMGIGYAITCPVLAVVCFSIGTWYYLRRVEP